MKKHLKPFALLTLLLISPIFIFWLFEYGVWMIVCTIIYVSIELLCAGYCLTFYRDDNDKLHKDMSDTDVSICAFISTMGLLALAFHFMPLYMTEVNFIDRINYIFGTEYDVFYEWGIFVTFILFCSAWMISMAFGGLIVDCFKKNKLATLKGFAYTALFISVLFCSYKIAIRGYDPGKRNIPYRRQCDELPYEKEDSLERIRQDVMQKRLFWND